jgi:hypothetical protein
LAALLSRVTVEELTAGKLQMAKEIEELIGIILENLIQKRRIVKSSSVSDCIRDVILPRKVTRHWQFPHLTVCRADCEMVSYYMQQNTETIKLYG